MRGKEDSLAILSPVNGITPAYAGKRLRQASSKQLRWDHPRLCGEKKHCVLGENKLQGSPPPMRGKEMIQ